MDAASLITLNDNVLAAMDVETTGRSPWFNEVCQIAIVPLDCHLKPFGSPFYTNINPAYPQRMHPDAVGTHGLTLEFLGDYPDPIATAESLYEWFQSLNLVPGKRLIPLCHNGAFDIPFVQHWLDHDQYNAIFGYPVRDTQTLITALMDKAAFKNQPIPFPYASLKEACKALGIEIGEAHDALADCLATAEIYRTLINRGAW